LAESSADLQAALNTITEWPDTWEMAVNASKCGIMTTSGDLTTDMTLQGQKVDSIDQYTYLGYIMKSKWDVSGTIKNNKNKVRKAVYAAYSFLRRSDVLTALKIKFINSVLMPIGCYGGETFGMSEARCKPIQMEIDKAIRMVANVGKSAAMERIRDELGISSVFMRTSTARERAYHKWLTSKTWTADLIKAPIKAQMATWVTGSARWIKKFCSQDSNAMVIRKPIKRSRMLFSDAVKSDEYEKTSNEVYNRSDAKYPRSVDLKKVTTKFKPQINKKIMTIDMDNYVEVSLKHLVIGGNQSCLKKICSGGSDIKIGCAWPQFKAKKSANKMGFVFKSTEPEKTVSLERTAPTIKNLPFVTAAANKTNDGDKKAAEAKKLEPNDGSGSSHNTSVRTIRGANGVKKPPASSVAMIQPKPSTLKQVSSDYDTGSDYSTINNIKKKAINENKNTIETDYYEESSDYERSSSPIEIKKEHIIFNNNQSDSNGNKTPLEHSIMAGKARLGLIPQK
ncbi:hypothetical protein AYI70_g8041, partial [Smittium culicis]